MRQTIRVNHPLILHGITIYQASFADGGSDLKFKAWNLAGNQRKPAQMDAVSMREFPLDIGSKKYRLEIDQFTAMNVEDMSTPPEKRAQACETRSTMCARCGRKEIHQYRPLYYLPLA